MFAWRRANVAELNRLARERMAAEGRLSGPELVAPGGAHYAAGDRIVTLAPAAEGQVVTSERGVVTAVELEQNRLAIEMEDGRRYWFEQEEIGAVPAGPRLRHHCASEPGGHPRPRPRLRRTGEGGSWPTWP